MEGVSDRMHNLNMISLLSYYDILIYLMYTVYLSNLTGKCAAIPPTI